MHVQIYSTCTSLLGTFSNMFKSIQLGPHCTDRFKLVHYEVRLVGKQAVGILLECFLVYYEFANRI